MPNGRWHIAQMSTLVSLPAAHSGLHTKLSSHICGRAQCAVMFIYLINCCFFAFASLLNCLRWLNWQEREEEEAAEENGKKEEVKKGGKKEEDEGEDIVHVVWPQHVHSQNVRVRVYL